MAFSLSHGKRLDVGQIGLLLEDLPSSESGPIDLRAWFTASRADQPLDLEIGSGKGTFLVQQAKQMTQVNYIGLEWSRPFWRYAADRCRRHGLENVRLVRAEAAMFIRNYVPDSCLHQVHIYFPDPWPKKRHHKRRLVQENFLRDLHRALESGTGLVRIATDHHDYFQWMIEHVHRVSDIFEQLRFDSPESANQGELAGTNFERKYRAEGRPFHGMALKKRMPEDGG